MPNPSSMDLRLICGPMRCGELSIVGYYSLLHGLSKFSAFMSVCQNHSIPCHRGFMIEVLTWATHACSRDCSSRRPGAELNLLGFKGFRV